MSEAKQIWVDADACPNVIKEVLFRAADRVGILSPWSRTKLSAPRHRALFAACALRLVLTLRITKLCVASIPVI